MAYVRNSLAMCATRNYAICWLFSRVSCSFMDAFLSRKQEHEAKFAKCQVFRIFSMLLWSGFSCSEHIVFLLAILACYFILFILWRAHVWPRAPNHGRECILYLSTIHFLHLFVSFIRGSFITEIGQRNTQTKNKADLLTEGWCLASGGMRCLRSVTQCGRFLKEPDHC